MWTILPSGALADHCGGSATVVPDRGPPGTVFTFTANVGAPSDLTFFRDGVWSGSVFLPGSGDVSYTMTARDADVGHWVARATVRLTPECFTEAEFEVEGRSGSDSLALYILVALLALVALAGGAVLLRRSRA